MQTGARFESWMNIRQGPAALFQVLHNKRRFKAWVQSIARTNSHTNASFKKENEGLKKVWPEFNTRLSHW